MLTGQNQAGGNLGEWSQDEGAFVGTRMRQNQCRRGACLGAEGDQVEVDGRGVQRIGAILQQRHPDATAPALIVQPRARRALAGLLKLRAPGVVVLSINELPSAQPIEVIAVIGGESPEIPTSDPGVQSTAYSPEMETLAA